MSALPEGHHGRGRPRRWPAVVLGVLGLLAVVAYLAQRPSAVPERSLGAARALRVVAANVSLDNTSPDKAAGALRGLDADVLVVLEWTGGNLGPDLTADYHRLLDAPHPGVRGFLVLVREGLEATATLVPTPIQGPCRIPFASVRLRRDSQALTILGVHAPPPIAACREGTEPTLEYLAGLVGAGRLRADFGAGRRGDPLVMAGDFNALPWSPGLRKLRAAGLSDPHRGLAGSWAPAPWLPFLVRLDRVLASRDLTVAGSWVVPLPGSDHRAVAADILWSDG